ncbi:hypothetical protein ILUMI_09460, partial [Ignelater luminosus]
VGTQPEGQYFVSNKPKDVVLRLTKPIAESNKNITVDSWFCSIPLVEELCKIKLTLVGILRNNKKKLANELYLRYLNENKKVFAISSIRFDNAIDCDTGEDRKPEIIALYKITKAGVDVVDEMLLDIACINSQVIFSFNKPDTTLIRRKFLREIDLHLVKPQVYQRANDQRISRHLRVKAARISEVDPVPSISFTNEHDIQKKQP